MQYYAYIRVIINELYVYVICILLLIIGGAIEWCALR